MIESVRKKVKIKSKRVTDRDRMVSERFSRQ